MKKIMFILIPVLLGGLSFGVSYLMFKSDKGSQVAETQPTTSPTAGLGELPTDREHYQENIGHAEANFDDLARQVRAKQAQLDQKETQLKQDELRLASESERLKQEVAKLESVQMQTLEALRQVNEAKAKLDASRLVIAREEKVNLKLLAAKYNAMPTAQAGEILISMCRSGKDEMVVRILYLMSDRSSGKILSEMPDRAMAGRLTEMLSRVRDSEA